MKIVTAAEMREIDRITTERFGIPSLTLMENAGTAVADFVLSEFPAAGRVAVICGKGNNGGDGFVVARKLTEAGKEVRVLLLSDPKELRGDAAAMFKKLPIKPVVIRTSEEFQSQQSVAVFECAVLVDAILGAGFRPPVTGLYAEVIQHLSKLDAPIIAVDIPSGLDADAMNNVENDNVENKGAQLVIPARATVTFTAPRPAHVFSPLLKGPVVISPIGSPEEAIQSELNLEVIAPRDIARCVAPRTREANKGDFGHVLIIGGSLGKAGAAAMAGMAALRAGAGLVTVATPKSVQPTVAAFAPELMTEPLPETEEGTISLTALEYGRLEKIIQGKTVIAIGPGISRNADTAELVRILVKQADRPTVLDADGLNAFQGQAQQLTNRPVVITPHPGEMSRLTGLETSHIQRNRIHVARDFANKHRITVVLKGHRTLIAEPGGKVWANTTGNPGMATGGMGDILTGMLAGLMASCGRNKESRMSLLPVLAAVHLHGLAGDISCEMMGEHSLVATDLLGALPEAFRRARASNQDDTVLLNP